MALLRSETDEKRRKVFSKHISESIASAGFLKTVVKDKKHQMAANMGVPIKASKQPVGIGCLGAQYIFAHDFYKTLGEYYFNMATNGGVTGILPAVKKCFLFAAQNLKRVIDVAGEEKKLEYLAKFNKTLSFAETI